jgi:hypothetical protein
LGEAEGGWASSSLHTNYLTIGFHAHAVTDGSSLSTSAVVGIIAVMITFLFMVTAMGLIILSDAHAQIETV